LLYQRLSIEYHQAIKICSIKGKTCRETAAIYRTSASTVVRRFDELTESTTKKELKYLPKTIALDEY